MLSWRLSRKARRSLTGNCHNIQSTKHSSHVQCERIPRTHGKGTNLPTKFSSTELFPALWPPTTAICGRSKLHVWPMELNASWSLLIRGMRSSIPRFPIVDARSDPWALSCSPARLNKSQRVALPANQKFLDDSTVCPSLYEFFLCENTRQFRVKSPDSAQRILSGRPCDKK